MNDTSNPLLCNPETGFCEMPASENQNAQYQSAPSGVKTIRIVYFTDPICSSCWGIEPQLRKLKLEYGNEIEMEYRMGGLLPDWTYNSGGISKPSDVAHHWDEVSRYYDMPIDGDVWLEDPLHSSYPPSIAFKAAQLQDENKAILFLRKIREMVFLEKKNITKWEFLEKAAQSVGLDTAQFQHDYQGRAKERFEEDLKKGKELGVRGFPTLFFSDPSGRREMVYGSKPYGAFEDALRKLRPEALPKPYQKTWENVFSKFPTLTAKEFAELMEIPRGESEKMLDELEAKGNLEKYHTKNGAIWKRKSQTP